MLWNITYSEYYLHMTYLHAPKPLPGGLLGIGGCVAIQRIQRYLRRCILRNKILYLLAQMPFKYQLTVRVDVGSAYLRDVMQDSACPSSLHKNRSFSHGYICSKRSLENRFQLQQLKL